MANNYKFSMDKDHKDMVRSLTCEVGSFLQDRLINKQQRLQHKEQCAERLAAQDESSNPGDSPSSSTTTEQQIRYSDQAVLANLDWGIDALEEAIDTSNFETKLARLDYAEKMLQVCAMLNSSYKTAGVPNFYLSAWSHLYLAYLWKLRNNLQNSLLHVLDMFIIDPFFSRIDFAPDLWKTLFLPHMSSIVGWYSESRHRLVMEVIPDSADLSFTADFDHFFNDSILFSMRPDQAIKLQNLEQLYAQSLDDNTKLFAKYYKSCISNNSTSSDAGTTIKRVVPMLPIAEPPMTPLHEVSRSIPDYVKFGPILPKSAGFSPFLKDQSRDDSCRLNTTSSPTQETEESANWNSKVKNECDFDPTYGDGDMHSEIRNVTVTPNSVEMADFVGSKTKVKESDNNDSTHSSPFFSPRHSPTTPPKFLTPSPVLHCKKEPEPLLRLLSGRLTNQTSSSSLPLTPWLLNGSSISPADSDGEAAVGSQKSFKNSISFGKSTNFGNNSEFLENSYLNESEEDRSQSSSMSVTSSGKLTPLNRPPKDFVCPITGQLLSDPVTLETGQTFERKAIQEWLNRGNTTCPITRQPLSANVLPKTNYVLKRLITSWKDQYPDIAQEFSYSEGTPRASIHNSISSGEPRIEVESASPSARRYTRPTPHTVDLYANNKRSNRFMQATPLSTSPTSVISQATIEAVINGIKPYTSCLCTSEDLQDCEEAVSIIARTWNEFKGDPGLHSHISKPTIINAFAEILLASLNRDVLRDTVYILSDLMFVDENVVETLTNVDTDFDCLAALLKNGLSETAVLIYQLRPVYAQLSAHDLIPPLVQVISNRTEFDNFQLVIDPKEAAVALLEQLLIGGEGNSRLINALNVISANGLPYIIKCLDRFEGRRSVVSVLLSCMRADRTCRNFIAKRVQLAHVLELFHAGDDSARGICVDFLSELVCLNRRTFCNQILQIIKDEGAVSTMHTFLVYLQMAPIEQQPAVACLLLQLDLLAEPRKMSIYREEAIETLVEALRRKDFPICQIRALDAFASLSGGLTASGKGLTEAWLLKIAGLDQSYNLLMKEEKLLQEDESTETKEEEENSAQSWGKHVALVLCNHENGSIFKALEECLNSNSLEMAKSCLVVATWLIHMLTILPVTGVRDTARRCLLNQFINVLQSSRNLEEKALATVALRSFIDDDQVALREVGIYAKSICKSLRKLKRSSVIVADILKALMNLSSINATELWSCTKVTEIDSGSSGEVLSLVHLKGRIFSSHSDGTIKVWDSGKRVLRLAQEAREHTKAVTCLFVSSSGDKLYSGSLDKTIRVWAIKLEEIHCIQVHEVKEAVHELVANNSFACFTSQGTGVKVYNWSGVPKQINFNKYVKCLAMTDKKLYCGCTGYSIQEVDLSKYTWSAFFAGTKKLLGKQTIHALCIRDGLLYVGGSSVDGAQGKVFSLSTKTSIGALPTGFDIHCIAVNSDFIFSATKCGTIDVWLRERLVRVGSLSVATRITSLVSDGDGDMLFAASSDGKIQAWVLD